MSISVNDITKVLEQIDSGKIKGRQQKEETDSIFEKLKDGLLDEKGNEVTSLEDLLKWSSHFKSELNYDNYYCIEKGEEIADALSKKANNIQIGPYIKRKYESLTALVTKKPITDKDLKDPNFKSYPNFDQEGEDRSKVMAEIEKHFAELMESEKQWIDTIEETNPTKDKQRLISKKNRD